MKSLLRLLFAIALLAGPIAGAAVFEGRMTLTMTSGKDRATDLNYAIKGHLIRLEIAGGKEQVAMIMDAKKMEMITLMAEQKMYMVMSVKGVADSAQKSMNSDEYSIEKTGRTEKILGYTCEEYVSTDKKRSVKTEIWMAEGLGTFMGLGAGGGGGPFGGGRGKGQSWEEAFKGKPGMPLRVVSRDARSKETFKMEATKIEPGSLPDSLFAPPADYQKFEMPDLGGLNPFRKK